MNCVTPAVITIDFAAMRLFDCFCCCCCGWVVGTGVSRSGSDVPALFLTDLRCLFHLSSIVGATATTADTGVVEVAGFGFDTGIFPLKDSDFMRNATAAAVSFEAFESRDRTCATPVTLEPTGFFYRFH